MKVKKEKLYLTKLGEASKNPPPNKYVLVYTEIEDEDEPVNKPKKKNTLVALNQRIDQLAMVVERGFKKMDDKMDAGFKQVNSRIDKIDTRLDYIVKANKLKDLPKSK